MASKDLTFVLLGEDKSASKAMTGAAETAEAATGRIGGAFTKVGGIVGGEFGEVLSKTGEGLSQVGEHAGKMSTGLTVGGAAITGVGVALQTMGSADKQAQDQLRQSVENSGHSFDDYKEEIEKTITKQEGFGHSAVDTQSALQKLTQSTGDPKKALEQMGLAADLAAAKHISLSDASDMLGKVINGKGGKILAAYGITMEKTTVSAKDLAAAQDGVTKAGDTLANAQEKLSQLEEIQHSKKTLSVADHIALQNAQQKVADATTGLADAQAKQTEKQNASADSTKGVEDALGKLAGKLDGQSTASVDNFGAQINVAKTRLGDWAAAMGEQVGPALTALGPALMTFGVIMDLVNSKKAASAAASLAAAAATDAETVAATGAGVATTFLDGALAVLTSPITLIIAGIALLVGGFIYLWNNCQPFQDFFVGMWLKIQPVVLAVVAALGVGFTWLWNTVLKPVGAFIGLALVAIGTTMLWLWNNAIMPSINFIAGAFGWLWDSILWPIIEVWMIEFAVLGAVFSWLWDNAISPAVNAIAASFGWLWDSVIMPVVGLIVAYVQVLGSVYGWLWSNAISPAINGIASAFQWVWLSVIQPISGWIGGAAQSIGDAFGRVFGGIAGVVGGAFGGVSSTIRSNINMIIDLVNGAIGGINKLGDAAALIPGAPHIHLGNIPRLAAGGIVSSPTMALIGEAGPEAIVPLSKGHGLDGGGSGGVTVNVNLSGTYAGDKNSLAQTIVTAITQAAKQGAIPKNAFSTALTGA